MKNLLSPGLQEAFHQVLLQPHPRDGLWTPPGGLASGWDPRRAWSWMRRLGFAPCAHDPAAGRPTPRRGPLSKKTLPDGFLVEAALPLAVAGGMGFCCAPAGARAHPPTGMGPAGPGAAPLSRAVVRPGTGESEYGLPGAVLFCPAQARRGGQAGAGWAGTPPGRYRCRRVWGFVFCHPTRLSCSRWSEPGG